MPREEIQMSFRPAITRWLPSYDRSWLRGDAVAGATVAAVLIPSALSYAAIVGVEPIVGLYTVPFALVAYAIFGGSRLLVVGPDAALSVLAASTIAGVATGDDYLEVMLALSLLAGGVFVLFWILRMGWVADLVPDPVLKGFIQGRVWVTILGQVPALLGVTPEEDFPDFWRDLVQLVKVLGDIQTETALLGVGGLAVLVVLKRFAPKVPGSLVVLIGSMVVVAPGQQTRMQVHACLHGQRLQEVGHQAGPHASHAGGIKTPLEDAVAPPADVHRHQGQRLVHGHHGVAHTGDARPVAQRPAQGLSQADAHVFHRVVLVHVQVARRADGQIKAGVTGQGRQHVVQEANAGVDFSLAAPVKIKADFDLSFACLPAQRRRAWGHPPPSSICASQPL